MGPQSMQAYEMPLPHVEVRNRHDLANPYHVHSHCETYRWRSHVCCEVAEVQNEQAQTCEL